MSPQVTTPPIEPQPAPPNGVTGVSGSAVRLAVADLRASKTNPRKTFDPAFIAELAGSMKRHGFVSTILVRPHPTEKNAFEIVAGEQRYRAAKEAGLTHVQALVRQLEDNEVLELQIIENLHRRDLTALEEADGYNVLMRAKYTVERIAEKIGRTGQYVRDRCRLLKLVKGARELLEQGRIEVGHAILLARISPEDQVRTIRVPGPGYDDARHSGLWQRQRDLPATLDNDADWKGEGLKPVSTRELQAWIQDHVRLKPEAEQTAELFPDVAKVYEAAQLKEKGVRGPRFVEITMDHGVADDIRDPNRRVLGNISYKPADGKRGKECSNSICGFIVAGPGQGDMLKVCVDKKKCHVHYQAEIAARAKREAKVAKSGKTGAERAALDQAERKKQEDREAAKLREQVERRKRAAPAVVRAIVENARSCSLSKLQAALRPGYREFNAAEKELGVAKTAEEFLRVAVLSRGLEHLAGFTERWFDDWSIKRLETVTGVDVGKVVVAANANEQASKDAKSTAKKSTAKKSAAKPKSKAKGKK